MEKQVRTAVITAGGYGTRFLPFTKAVPKELLPLEDTPTLEILVRECINAGISTIFVITRSDSDVIQKHFSLNIPYEEYLTQAGKTNLLKKINCKAFSEIEIVFVQENEELPYGNARGLFTIRHELEKLPNFLLLFGDDIVLGKKSSIEGIIKKYVSTDCAGVVGVQKVPIQDVPRYGNVKIKQGTEDVVESLIQKPSPEEVVSDLVIFSQLVLTPEIFRYLNPRMRAEELDAGVALNKLAQKKKILTYKPDGKWVTIGDPINYIKANLYLMISTGLLEKEDIVRYIKSL